MLSESEINQLIQAIPRPTSEGRIRVYNFEETNLYVYREFNGGLGILLSEVGDTPDFPEFRNITFRAESNVNVYHSDRTNSQLDDVFSASFSEGRFDLAVIFILEYMLESVDGDHYISRDLIDTIMLFKELLASPKRHLSLEEKIGIWGELWFIRRTFRTALEEDQREKVIMAWENSKTSASDFNFKTSSVVIEVKTTIKDSRVHTISSAEQMSNIETPSDVDQYVASMACRLAHPPSGWTISRLVEVIQKQIQTNRLSEKFDDILRNRGWSQENSDICLTIRPGVQLALFKKEIVPTVIPLQKGIIQANWQVILDEQNKESGLDLIIQECISS